MHQRFLLLLAGLLLSPFICAQTSDLNTELAPVKARHIGPFRGGRANTANGVIGDPLTYYMGNTGGGVWKTEDAGQYWTNISDGFFGTGTIGAIAVAPTDPNIVYVGTGEHAVRGVMTSSGDGFYKSTDAGRTWNKIGLENSRHISRIRVHPTDPNTLWVGVQGALYGPSEERGVYKSTDGGTTWKRTLFTDNLSGCVEIDLDQNNPLIMYAAMNTYGRKPWKVISGGAGSGLYKSTDGGESWEKAQTGLPKELGKIGLSVCQSNPDKVYAVVESDSEQQLGGLFVTTDGAKNWSRVSDDHRLTQRAWYYTEVFADPANEDMVYVMSAPMLRSKDGGKNWEVMSGPHGDYHDLWINPANPKNMVLADDGGAGITFNRGESWSRQDNMPTVQFYRVSVDNNFPYRLYGGQQDNSSVRIDSRNLNGSSIGPEAMTASAGGESAFLAFDPDDPRLVMGGSYLGTIDLLDTETGASVNVMAAPIQYLALDAKDMKYRYNWNAPIIRSQHDKNVWYHAAQKMLRTSDLGITWEEASPDLTRNEVEKQGKGGGPYTNESVGAESYGTISYVIESPHEAGVIWTGSDDGLVHLTRDNGESWKNVTPAGLKECLINAIEVSPHDAGTAYIATTRYKFDDHQPGLYVTKDYGKTWKNISAGIPDGAFTRVVREDDKVKGLLFAGTETGLYASWNGGAKWEPLQLNLPVTPITDLAVKHDDLIVATAGRGFWIVDDLGLLRQWKNEPYGLHVYQPEPVVLTSSRSELDGNSGDGVSSTRGVNPASGMVLYYHLPEGEDDSELTLEITNAEGKVVRTLSSKPSGFTPWAGGPGNAPTLSASPGLNRFVWDLRTEGRKGVEQVYIEGGYRGHKVSPGTYMLTFRKGDETVGVKGVLEPNPLYNVSPEAYRETDTYLSELTATLNDMHDMVNQLHDAHQQISNILEEQSSLDEKGSVRQQGEALIAKLSAWDDIMVQRKSKAYDDVENYVNGFTADYLFLLNQSESGLPRITNASRARRTELDAAWARYKAEGMALKDEIQNYNKALWAAGVGAVRY
ncbi:glycosyl hydrolase [Neolewinella aurantiaca]|uniref:Glycosyl hydrolase n=1 Tax=Neolewinella aurantiaca TaxID=2602767 RepID=A0A5C7FZS1_9BACT|nr:glycosyl hydrolase [Neolewinella aurantiaca]TXF90818.1 glycosyl hydrolase [Neolewinella aurantiaca]